MPSQAEEAFGELAVGQGGGRMENDERGMLGGTEDNWDYVSDWFTHDETNIYGIVLNSHTEYAINPFFHAV